MTAPVLDPAGLPEQELSGWPVPDDEPARIAALRAYGVLDQPRQGDLDAAARLAAYICGTPTATVNLIDADRQWQAAAHGTEPVEVPRGDAMCQHTVLGTGVVYTSDASAEALFVDNPFVTGRTANIRLYASAPLLTRDGHAVGTICVFDERPGSLDSVQLGLLGDVAAQVMALFEMRRIAAVLNRAATRDPLTGLGNRRAVEAAIHAAIGRAERGLGTPSVAQRFTATARSVDTVARLGGDEFVVLLEHTGGPGATAALSRLRRSLDGGWSEVTGGHEVSAALGITTYRAGDSVATLPARADAEMYADKARRAGSF